MCRVNHLCTFGFSLFLIKQWTKRKPQKEFLKWICSYLIINVNVPLCWLLVIGRKWVCLPVHLDTARLWAAGLHKVYLFIPLYLILLCIRFHCICFFSSGGGRAKCKMSKDADPGAVPPPPVSLCSLGETDLRSALFLSFVEIINNQWS